tara:strand:- start:1865 stop:2548 length:684 start_codon:yes stop_codon:yes gene_type:complete
MSVFTALNMDRQLPVCVRPGEQLWLTAAQAPVRRWPLEREAPESGQVTSLVEYLPGAHFPQHLHPQGEEILVLSGVFSDESGDYPAGSYLRSPAGSRHSPFSAQGCLLFVKLNQFAADDRQCIRLRPEQQQWQVLPSQQQSLLHSHGDELTLLVDCAAGAALELPAQVGGELLVLQGAFEALSPLAEDANRVPLPRHSWLRDTCLASRGLVATEPGRVLLKLSTLRG